jgi:Fe-S oxidoreductase
MLTSTDRVGRLASIPVVAQIVNKANRDARGAKGAGQDDGHLLRRTLPTYRSARFRETAGTSLAFPVKDGARTPGKVAIFATCYVNYIEPGIGHDLLAILAHNEVPYTLVEKEVCCGMPKLGARRPRVRRETEERQHPDACRARATGHAILTCVPSCTLMFKTELPLIFPGDDDVRVVSDAMFDPFEYLVLRDKDGLLRKDFRTPLGKVSYPRPVPLARAEHRAEGRAKVLEWIPETTLNTVERCAGHDGTYGVKREFYANSMKIGTPVFNRMAEPAPTT